MEYLAKLKKKLFTGVSAPVITLIIALVTVSAVLWVLWRMNLLTSFLDSGAFQTTAFLLALLAIIFGSIQFWDARRHSSKMEQVAESMSTRYIGVFPKDMDDIISVVGLADQELLVISDCADYGSYSRPETHDRLFEAVKKAREKGITVRWMVYGEKKAQEALTRQFSESGFEETLKSHKFRNYLSFWPGIQAPSSYQEFLKLILNKERDVADALLDKGVELRTISEDVWLFFFMQDRQDAVFLFEDIGAQDQGLAFRTRDAKLVETFCGIFSRYWTNAQPVTRSPR